MADTNRNDNPADNQAKARFQVTGQYVKDLSFENPSAPQSFAIMEEKPSIQVNIDLNAQKLQDNLFEVALKISASAQVKDNKLFMVELAYAGLFVITGIPEERLEAILFVDCPFVLFPYARRVISDVTRDGGYPPLLLEPVDFFSLYRNRLELKNKAQASSETVQ
jgi:preprotein translocase subunit SecB